MKNKLGWVLFSIMTVVAIVLSSVLIAHGVRWKSGKELLDLDVENIQSASAVMYGCLTDEGYEIDLSEDQIKYIVNEFNWTKFENDNETYLGGIIVMQFIMKDGKEIEFTVDNGCVRIDGKKYIGHSYLSRYCYELFYNLEEEN